MFGGYNLLHCSVLYSMMHCISICRCGGGAVIVVVVLVAAVIFWTEKVSKVFPPINTSKHHTHKKHDSTKILNDIWKLLIGSEDV